MPIWDKQRKTWIARVRLSGFPTRKKRGFTRKIDAAQWEREEKAKLLNPTQTPSTFSQVSSEYLAYCQKRFQKNTWRQKAFIIRSLISSIGYDPPINDPDITNQIIAYLDNRFDSDGGKAANRDLREITTLFNWIIKYRYPDLQNPAKPIDPYKEPEFIKYVPPMEDITKVVLAAEGDVQDFIMAILQSAARSGELLRLTWEDVMFDTLRLRLWTRKRKGGSLKSREIDMTPTLLDIMIRRHKNRNKISPYVFPNKNGGRGSKYTWDNVMPRLCKKAGVNQFGFHALRHFVAGGLAENKVPLTDIQNQLGHQRTTTTDIYLKSIIKPKNRTTNILEDLGQKILGNNGKVINLDAVRKNK